VRVALQYSAELVMFTVCIKQECIKTVFVDGRGKFDRHSLRAVLSF
jgi:hypothetical protein